MGKPSSYTFEKYFKNENKMIKTTSEVWDKIIKTQEEYPNTKLPRSFIIKLGNVKLWVHPNATKHMYEEIFSRLNGRNSFKNTDIKLYTQLILYDFYQTLNLLTKNEIKYSEPLCLGNREFEIRKGRKDGDLPTVVHAFFKGWNKKE